MSSPWILPLPNQPGMQPTHCEIPVALLSGYAVYTTFQFPIASQWFEAHITRLASDAAALGLEWGYSADWIQKQIEKCTTSNQPVITRLTVFADADAFSDFFKPQTQACRLLLSTRAIPSSPNQSITLKTIQHQRPIPLIKLAGIGDLIHLKRQAMADGYDDILLVNPNGHITEASTANFFAIDSNGTLLTADPQRDGCLPGITRQQIIALAQELKLSIQTESALSSDQIAHYAGAFLTNAAQGIIPIARINQHTLPWPKLAQEILRQLQAGLF